MSYKFLALAFYSFLLIFEYMLINWECPKMTEPVM